MRVVPAEAADPRTFATVLAIDTSESMRGAPIQAAMAAAREFAAQRPAQQRLGVVFFNSRVTLALPPTTDAGKISQALSTPPPLATGTRIYDATALATRVLADARASARSVLLLSDGADLGSDLAPGAVVDAARLTKTRIFSVGLRSPQLRRLDAAQPGGRNGRPLRGGRRAPAGAAVRRTGPTLRARVPRQLPVARSARRLTSTFACGSPAWPAPRRPATGLPRSAPPPGPRTAQRASTFLGSNASLGLAVVLAALLFGFAAFLVRACKPPHRAARG